jgi:hypothetical protein
MTKFCSVSCWLRADAMNGIIAGTPAITVAPKGTIESAIGIAMTTETVDIHIDTEMTRTETGAI